jgi:RNA polymerase-binding transcription factor DksA
MSFAYFGNLVGKPPGYHPAVLPIRRGPGPGWDCGTFFTIEDFGNAMTDFVKIKTQLENELKTLSSRVEEIDDHLSQSGDDDWEEHAMETADDEVLNKVGNVTLEEIREIKLTLSRIEDGTYGTCARCSEPIAKARMKALPYATKCVRCS